MDEIVQRLSDEATEYIRQRYGRVAMMCREASGRLMTLLRNEGIKARKVSGFWGYSTHWWVELENGTIVDPTAEQFYGTNGIQKDTSRYDEVPRDLVMYLPKNGYSAERRMISNKEAWNFWKKLIQAGAPAVETRGQELVEERVDKKGRTYTYIGHQVTFTWGNREQLRAEVIYRHDSGNMVILECWQRRYVKPNGVVSRNCVSKRRVIKPFVSEQYGSGVNEFESVKGKLVLVETRWDTVPPWERLPMEEIHYSSYPNNEDVEPF